MTGYDTRPLDAGTWPDFARLVEANNGVWGGCWCLWCHGPDGADTTPAARRAAKEARGREGRAQAALVYRGADCVGWCQFGSPGEHPRLHSARAYLAGNTVRPDWRITCLFAGRGHRGAGVAQAALAGAVAQIGLLGGGRGRSANTSGWRP